MNVSVSQDIAFDYQLILNRFHNHSNSRKFIRLSYQLRQISILFTCSHFWFCIICFVAKRYSSRKQIISLHNSMLFYFLFKYFVILFFNTLSIRLSFNRYLLRLLRIFFSHDRSILFRFLFNDICLVINMFCNVKCRINHRDRNIIFEQVFRLFC